MALANVLIETRRRSQYRGDRFILIANAIVGGAAAEALGGSRRVLLTAKDCFI
jgi:hypothetical protein